jgi:hypothetical protein
MENHGIKQTKERLLVYSIRLDTRRESITLFNLCAVAWMVTPIFCHSVYVIKGAEY